MTNNLPFTAEIKGHFEKIAALRNEYAEAGENAGQEVEQLKVDIDKLTKDAHETYRSYVLGVVTLETYQEAQNKLNDKQKLIEIAEGKADSIQQLLQEELHSIYNDIQAVESEFKAENNTNKAKQRQAIHKAKQEYLKAINTAGKETRQTDNIHYDIDKLKVELGFKKDFEYDMDNANVQALLGNAYTGTAGAEIGRQDIEQAFDNH